MISGERGLVGFEATALELRNRSGVGHYTAQLLGGLVQRGGWRYALLTSRPPAGRIPQGVVIPPQRHFPNRSLWVQLVLPRIVARLHPRLCHFTNSVAPLALSCPFVVTVYDMCLFLFPRLQPRKSLLSVRSILPYVARKASAIITISHSARRDILRVLKVPAQKVHVVYAAAADEYRMIEDAAELERARRKYRLDTPFFLAVSTVEPRKNLSGLIKALAKLRRRGRKEQLILAGQLGWRYRPLLRQIEQSGLKDTVRLLGYVPDRDLPAIYNLARAVAFPSFYEGFGLPIVEAMACGTPVLTSNRSSMAEVGEGAALLVDPSSEDEIEQGMLRLVTEESLRAELRAAGLARAAQFSWARAAEETAAVYGMAVP
ncbi:MAG: glycosyltransferase family 4 protein [Acidobacteriia bacterium]|nr:glycosyltransferase family 4 protein [Terriglobia bacterium]